MAMRFATLISWLLTVSLGAYMLRTWLARGGLRRARAQPGGLPPQLIFSHAGLAITGLLVWAAYVGTGVRPLAWTAIGFMVLAIGLGLSTVTLWTPYPARKPGERRGRPLWDEPAVVIPDTPAGAADGARGAGGAGAAAGAEADPAEPEESVITDEMIARLLDNAYSSPGRSLIAPDPAVLVPIAHGVMAISTFLLAVLAAITLIAHGEATMIDG
jgi:hypothetical protein